MTRTFSHLILPSLLVCLGACAGANQGGAEVNSGAAPTATPPAPPPSAPEQASAAPIASAAPSASAVSTSAPPEAVAASPEGEIDFPSKGLATLPDDCAEPSVVLTTAPTKMGWDYDWTWTRQALFANPQFQLVDWPGKPEKPMQVKLDMYEIPKGFALVGVCKDAKTCNKLAAMYRATVPTCDPKLHCGSLGLAGAPRASKLIPADGKWLPLAASNVVGRCARIGVCLNVKHERSSHNPGVECQSSPQKLHAECAVKETCDEVVACLHKAGI